MRIKLLLSAVFISLTSMASAFPTYVEPSEVRQTADYRCVGKCRLTYEKRHNGFVDTILVDVGPVTVTVGSPSENAINAAAQVALTGRCPSACDDNLPSGSVRLGCRVGVTGPCARIR